MRRVITLYGKRVCPLCDEGYETVRSLAERHGLEVEKVDIEGDAELEVRYGQRIPVAVLDGEELGWGRLSRRALERKLSAGGR